jgi:hypothetical protein
MNIQLIESRGSAEPEAFVVLSVGIIGINKKKFLNKELQMCSAQWSAGWRFCIK